MLTTYTGKNSFLIDKAVQTAIAAFLESNDEMGLVRIDGAAASNESIADALLSMPFLIAKKLVIIKDMSANKIFIDKIESLFQ